MSIVKAPTVVAVLGNNAYYITAAGQHDIFRLCRFRNAKETFFAITVRVCVRVGVWMCTRGQCIWQGRACLWPSESHFN